MTKKERVEALINFYSEGKKGDFANLLGVSASTISSWINRDTFDLELIFSKCKNVNPVWLITGRGSLQIAKNTHQSDVDGVRKFAICEEQSSYNTTPTPKTTSPDGIHLIPVDAMAGAMRGEVSVMDFECDRYVVPMFAGADFLIPVKGNSMYSKYNSGDIVACKRVPMTDLFFQWNKVYVLDTNQGALIKRIKPGSDTSRVLIVSENPAYDPFELPLEAIHAVALVMGVIRLE